MKVFSLLNIISKYEQISFEGTVNPDKKRCLKCRVPFDMNQPNIIEPILISFLNSKVEIPDFLFCSGRPYPIISQNVKIELIIEGVNANYTEVQVTGRRKNKIPFIDKKFYKLNPSDMAFINQEKTKLPKFYCTECNRESIQYLNNEQLFLETKKELNIFKIYEFRDGATCITANFLEKLINKKFSNLDNLISVGEIEKY